MEQGIVLCTIAAIDSDMGWYYLSCKVCAKKVLTVPSENLDDGEDEDGGGHSYYCAKCKVYNPKLLPRWLHELFLLIITSLLIYSFVESNILLLIYRYKLHIVVLDSTGNAKFLLFDNIAFHLIHTPCLELTGPNIDEVNYFFSPTILISLEKLMYMPTFFFTDSRSRRPPPCNHQLNW